MTCPKTALASVAASLALAFLSTSAQAAVVINEYLADPAGTDGNKEWVELYNNGDASVDVSGWKLQSATNPKASSIGVRATIPASTSIPAGGYYLIAGASVAPLGDAGTGDAGSTGAQYDMAGTLGNGTAVDMVRIVDDAGEVIDTVIYGPGQNDEPGDGAQVGFADDLANPAVSFAPNPSSAKATARKPNGVDTNLSADDFVNLAAGQETPGAKNYEAPPVPDGGTSSSSSSSSSSGSSSGRPSSSSSSSSGGKSSSSSGGSGSAGTSSGGKNGEGDDDDDNSNLAADDGGCNVGAATPGTFLLGIAALFVMRRRRR